VSLPTPPSRPATLLIDSGPSAQGRSMTSAVDSQIRSTKALLEFSFQWWIWPTSVERGRVNVKPSSDLTTVAARQSPGFGKHKGILVVQDKQEILRKPCLYCQYVNGRVLAVDGGSLLEHLRVMWERSRRMYTRSMVRERQVPDLYSWVNPSPLTGSNKLRIKQPLAPQLAYKTVERWGSHDVTGMYTLHRSMVWTAQPEINSLRQYSSLTDKPSPVHHLSLRQ
jgi:hypothetical protein